LKIGLISDIHADLTGLRRALKLLKREAVDSVLCLGDLVDKGPEGDLVVLMLEAMEIPCIQGNHDKDAPINQQWRKKRADDGIEYAAERLLTSLSLAYLKTLPPQQRYTWDGVRVLAVHGSPENNMDYLFEKAPLTKFEALARAANADVILCGHTHEPMHVRANGVHFMNPGSVCADYAHGSGTCATLTLPEIDFRVFSLGTGQAISF
jgi:putative phosphoesterase